MSTPRPTDPACGCSQGLAVATPRAITNRPGLPALDARVGDHASLRQTLIARLTLCHAENNALAGLSTRAPGDFTLGLLDAWASAGDVLAFYQERIANESYLGTATERLSVQELARLIDYRLRPGVASSTCIAFTLEDPPGTTRRVAPTADTLGSVQYNAAQMGVPQRTRLEAGLKVQSVPGPGESAQVFETIEPIDASPAWNALKPRLTARQTVAAGNTELRLEGLATGLKKGDALLIPPTALGAGGGELTLCRIGTLQLDDYHRATRVGLGPRQNAGSPPASLTAAAPAPGASALQFVGRATPCADFHAATQAQGIAPLDVLDNLRACRAPAAQVVALRGRAAIFGHNAPRYEALPSAQRFAEYAPSAASSASLSTLVYQIKAGGFSGRAASWVDGKLDAYPGEPAGSARLYLDAVYPNVTAGSWITLVDGSKARSYRVDEATEISKSDFTLSARVTRLTLATSAGLGDFGIRSTAVYCESEAIPLARQPLDTPVEGDSIELDGLVDGLRVGQKIALCGELDTERGVTACEIAEIAAAEHALVDATHLEAFTRLRLKAALTRRYVRSTVSLNANVALATHGESVANFGAAGETLGSGDATQAFQRFTLAQAPLTHVSAATGSGTRSTLQVRVQGLLWAEVPSLYGRGPDERVYVTRQADDGKTSVIFGDGVNGARLPTGSANVSASYRKGIGSAGRVAAHQLTQLLSRPLGLKAVTNPLAADGGADPQGLEQARRNAPLAILTLGRIVSLQDYEDFAAAFAGIGQATAVAHMGGVFITVAGADGVQPADDGLLLGTLRDAILAAGDPLVPLAIKPYAKRLFRVGARIASAPDARRAEVLAAVEAALRAAFAFERRRFGQPVHAAEVVAVIQQVPGVEACALDALHIIATGPAALIEAETPGVVHAHLPAAAAAGGQAAELLLLDPAPIPLGAL
ncbi:MAG: putative baseplate assembly protein [Zoogloea sp.]|uniref:putative baseplate assembly protein n=1 Tax=Zoogloea sp. TaxID=49181 RepID=UPI0026293AF8|nr:putative baseplate assembly protein [Zoogloea sp.]MDD3329125.1 putative baseplate assembly protein [Zoogloea sp.]